VEQTKLSRKVLYHFAIFAIINDLLIIKNCCINPAYCLMLDATAQRLRLLGTRKVVFYWFDRHDHHVLLT